MTQELDLDAVIRARIRGLRRARGWALDALAGRCGLSPSTDDDVRAAVTRSSAASQ
jgi:transcriptional regulator with XRE-family HTH domain